MKHSLSTALLTDMYELTMIESAFETGRAELPCVFEVFGRRLPGSRRYGVVAGTGRILEALQDFTFGDEEITYLRDAKIVGERTLDFLKYWRFTGDIYGYAEGECYFPYSPLLTVVGTFAECVVLETLVLSMLNYDSAVATAASRVTIAAHDRPCLEMGARRTHEYSAVAAARAAVIGGFVGTSDLEAGRRYGISTIGTAAHSFTLLHDSEDEAFAAQIRTLGPNTTLLVDTYNIHDGVEKAVAAARAAGGELGAVRLDSGDLVAQAFKVRAQLDELGATTTKITVTSDLDEYAIAALNAAPVDSYGVGTKLVTGSGHPTAQLVYKLVARQDASGAWTPVQKKSESKSSRGGLKVAGRKYDVTGRATAELIVTVNDFEDGIVYLKEQGARPLQVALVSGGKIHDEYMNATALGRAAERHRSSRAALPYNAWRLSEGEPGIPTEFVDIR
ncbi:nicotinate phosphoribosyltransferase [Arcanobacterium buesumense]|uniref:Nicotinate phosphoribosyltransferase n=1 Tax=Arcanobacterium buesumense TaxID=2722751 RepID=A0A6H2ELW5_9ACTO|nr:nicotinate phosphoribosyltransferase [Arcanobacterium buesumense]QJC22052.1 nicotinate phosphoribosyltransferase [Arcanobacterium buesumense]